MREYFLHNDNFKVLAMWLLILLFAFGMARCKPDPEPQDQLRYIRLQDSLKNILIGINADLDQLKKKQARTDSLMKINYKKAKNEIKQIDTFTGDSRRRWADSVNRANNINE